MYVEVVVFVLVFFSVVGIVEYGELYLYDFYWIRVVMGCVGSNADD